VLIIDDNPGMLETLADIVNAAGYDVDTVLDGKSALQQLRTVKYDIGVFDIVLPDINGVDLIRTCREQSLLSRFVVITAYHGSELFDESKLEGAATVLPKPLDPGMLVAEIRRLYPPA
jgi:DNA-binding response OmpR family regulator